MFSVFTNLKMVKPSVTLAQLVNLETVILVALGHFEQGAKSTNARQHAFAQAQRSPGFGRDALLAPGRYVVTSETRDQALRGAFEVKAGETRTIEIGG